MKVCDFLVGPAVARGIVTVADTTMNGGGLLTVSGGNTARAFSVSGVNAT